MNLTEIKRIFDEELNTYDSRQLLGGVPSLHINIYSGEIEINMLVGTDGDYVDIKTAHATLKKLCKSLKKINDIQEDIK